MWEEAKGSRGALSRPEKEGPAIRLTVANYESIGGLQGALDKHAYEITTGLANKLGDDPSLATTRNVFRAVTTGTTVADAVRHPTAFGKLVEICGDDTAAAVHAVVNAFRAEGCNFLQPEIDPAKPFLDDGDMVDITHESLIRQWTRLREWTREEFAAAETYRFIKDAAKRWKNEEGPLFSGRPLANAMAWRERERPNASWAARYGAEFDLAIKFLNAGVEAERLEAEKKLEAERREEARKREAERLEAERKLAEAKQEAEEKLLQEREVAKRAREKAAKRLQKVIVAAVCAAVIAGAPTQSLRCGGRMRP